MIVILKKKTIVFLQTIFKLVKKVGKLYLKCSHAGVEKALDQIEIVLNLHHPTNLSWRSYIPFGKLNKKNPAKRTRKCRN